MFLRSVRKAEYERATEEEEEAQGIELKFVDSQPAVYSHPMLSLKTIPLKKPHLNPAAGSLSVHASGMV